MTDRSKKQTYDTGYGRPPVSAQFRKDISGNPSGRPKRRSDPIDAARLLEAMDNEEIIVMDNGRRKRMSKGEISIRQLMSKATKGDLGAASILAKMAKRYFSAETRSKGKIMFVVRPNEPNPETDHNMGNSDERL